MGHDPVRGPDTYGSGCMPGCARQFKWWQETYDAGTLGCYNPASLGGRSLHAEGRAMDIALNANDPAQRARGDAIMHRVVANPDQFGAQELLWRGYLWSYRNRHLGLRYPEQQADHMNHVHLGIDVNAGKNWQPSWVGVPEKPKPELPKQKRRNRHMIFVLNNGEKGESYQYIGGPPTEKTSYIRLFGNEPLVNHDHGSPLVRLTKDEFKAYLAGADLAGLGARGWTF